MGNRIRHFGGLALGLGLAGALALAWGARRVRRWEHLDPADAPDGEFVELPDGTRVHYVVEGAGEPVLLIHGFLDSGYSWRLNMDAWSRGYRVYAPDLPGFGYSTRWSSPRYSLDQFAGWVVNFMDAAGIGSAHLVGHSLGGAIALEMAQRWPERVRSLVLEDAWCYLQVPEFGDWVQRVPASIPRGVMGLYLTNPVASEVMLRGAWGNPRRVDPETVRIVGRWRRVAGSIDALMAMASSTRANHVRELVRDCSQETLVIWGERDRTFPVAHAERLTRELAAARLAVIPEAGHVPHQEFPEQVNELVLNYWTSLEEKWELRRSMVGMG